MKCERCNRNALATALYSISSKNRKSRFCNNCSSIIVASRPDSTYLVLIEGSEDDGIVAPEERGPKADQAGEVGGEGQSNQTSEEEETSSEEAATAEAAQSA